MFKFILFILLVGCTTVPRSTRSPSSADPKIDQLASIAANDLKGQIQTLKYDTLVFHYEHSDQSSASTDPALFQKMNSEIGAMWDTTQSGNHDDTFGKGFYTSVGPVATAQFGTPNFALYVVQLHKGMTYLEYQMDFKYSSDFASGLKELGCGDDTNFPSFMSNGKPECHTLGTAIWKKLGVDAFAYPYVMGGPLQGCRRSLLAMILLNPDVLRASDLRVLFPEIPSPDPDADLRRSIEIVARNDLNKKDTLNQISKVSLWPSLQIGASEHATAWEKANLFDCQK